MCLVRNLICPSGFFARANNLFYQFRTIFRVRNGIIMWYESRVRLISLIWRACVRHASAREVILLYSYIFRHDFVLIRLISRVRHPLSYLWRYFPLRNWPFLGNKGYSTVVPYRIGTGKYIRDVNWVLFIPLCILSKYAASCIRLDRSMYVRNIRYGTILFSVTLLLCINKLTSYVSTTNRERD